MDDQKIRSFCETIILLWACCSWAPQQLSSGGFPLEAWALSLSGWCGVVALYVVRRGVLPKEWIRSTRKCLDSGLLYGTSLVAMSLGAHLLHPTDPDSQRHVRLNFWSSIANSLSVILMLLSVNDTTDDEEPWARRFGRAAISSAVVARAALDPERIGQHAYLVTEVFVFELVCELARKALRQSFSMGEALLVVQFLALGTTDFVAMTASRLVPQSTPYYATHRRQVDVALEGGLLGVLWLAVAMIPFFRRYAREENETIRVDPLDRKRTSSLSQVNVLDWSTLSLPASLVFYATCIVFLVGAIAPWVGFVLDENPILFVAEFTAQDWSHLIIALYWIGCLIAGLPLIHYLATRHSVTLIIIRKMYHLLALIMFAPAIKYAPDFLSLAFGIATAILLGIEYIRACRVPPLGSFLNAFMRAYTDSRDEGIFILTHIYLLLGCAVPVWVSSSEGIAPYAGVLILGAGDAAAAVIGSTLGTHRWIGGRKTIEGTLSGIVAIVICAEFILRIWTVASSDKIDEYRKRIFIASVTTCALEAFTSQIDNLVLPLFFVSALRM